MSDPRSAFAAAERAFVEGRFTDARALLSAIAPLRNAAVHHLLAIVEQKLGSLPEARRQFETALRLAPDDAKIWSNYGNLLHRVGAEADALAAYERSLALAPRFADPLYNRALLLSRLGRQDEAREAFLTLVDLVPGDVRYRNGLAAVEKLRGDLAAAAADYDRALEIAPGDRLANIGRARVALEREEPDALDRYRSARRLAPDDTELALDEAELRLGRGDRTALDDLADLVRSAPDWTHGQIALARMRWEQGEKSDFADHIERLLEAGPKRAELWRDYVQLLADCGEPARAADVARSARRALGDEEALRLLEAVHAGKAGQIERAEGLFETLAPGLPGREVHEAVHRIRRGNLDRAIHLVEAALAADPWDYAIWSIAELLYRKTGDKRAEWLSGQQGLVSVSSLPLDASDFRAATSLLERLHRDAVETVGQSVHGGTQTRWQLFDRADPEIARLREAIERAVASHWARLPRRDDIHPLLRHRERATRIGPSWSVRFLDAGHHVPHYHPKGLVSSACYFQVPPHSTTPLEGWLEIGRPPEDFLMDLEPIQVIEPKVGNLVLFPSYLFHGTRPFRAGERMSVAFDIVAAED